VSPPTPAGYFPTPSSALRLAGLGCILGAILLIGALYFLGDGRVTCTQTDCSADRATLGILALAAILLAVGVVGLELRASREPGLLDLVGDLSIGTAALLAALAFILGTFGLALPGLLLLLVGSTVFGIGGYFRGARPQMASALVGVGAGAFLFFLVGGPATADNLGGATPLLVSLLSFIVGWIWLGADLLLARPLEIPTRRARGR
jgi:hypothetical protein